MTEDGEKARLLAYLENIQIEETENYLRRGRSLRATPTDELQEHWVAEIEAWARAGSARWDHAVRNDVEAELRIRKEATPAERVTAAIERIREASRRADADRFRNPKKLARLEADLAARIDAFYDGAKRRQS